MNLIIINGLPATGKTTLARSLSQRLKVTIIAKDIIKEFLFDTLGVKDREWSRALGMVSSDFLYVLADAVLAHGQSVILESAFENRFAKPKIEELIEKYSPNVIEVYCMTEQSVRRQRFIERNQSAERHAGHMDHVNYLSDDTKEPTDIFAPLKLSTGSCLKIDTTDLDSVSIEQILRLINI